MSKILFLFLDGVGIGKENETNPFFSSEFTFFKHYFGETPSISSPFLVNEKAYLFGIDACMGVPGIPQSGTGQTAIYTGVNAPQIVGQHLGPFPPSIFKEKIKNDSFFTDFRDAGKKAFFANAYPKVFFDYINSGKTRLSVSTMSYMGAGYTLNGAEQVKAGKALSAEMTNEVWIRRLKEDVQLITASDAAERLLHIYEQNDFTLYEFFLTDHLGHGRLKEEFQKILSGLNEFLQTLFARFNYSEGTIFLCSDHGNLEDLSTKQHTTNPALGIAAGLHAAYLAKEIKSLYEIRGCLRNIAL